MADKFGRTAEYYAAKGIQYEEGFVRNARGMKLFTATWLPATGEPKGLVFLCHGYGMECSIFMAEAAERLALDDYAVFGLDYEGHGQSDGLQAYVKSMDVLVDDCIQYFDSVSSRPEYTGKAKFLYGESMGGAVALLIHRKQAEAWNGAVFVAPMCKISDKLKSPPLVTGILTKLAHVVPTWKIVPTKDIIDSAFKDPVKREQIRTNPYAYQQKPRLCTALNLLNTSNDLEKRLDEITIPFLLLHGEADTVTDPEVSRALYDNARSFDKTFRIYPGMWHGLTSGEPDDNVEIVFKDILGWLDKHCSISPGSQETVKQSNLPHPAPLPAVDTAVAASL
eukprot:SM000112S23958  [mRNA]  locus=s112:16993:19700:+ [translate_table: standard]